MEIKNIFAANQDMTANFHCPQTLGPYKFGDSLPRNATDARGVGLRNPILRLEIG